MKMKDGRTGAGVVACVLAGDAVDAVLPQIPFLRGRPHRLGGDLLERELVISGGRVDVEEDRAGVLAKRQRAVARKTDVAADDVERDVSVRSLDLVLSRAGNRANDI